MRMITCNFSRLGNGPESFTAGRFTAPLCCSEERVGQVRELHSLSPTGSFPFPGDNWVFFSLADLDWQVCTHNISWLNQNQHYREHHKTFYIPSPIKLKSLT